MNISRPAVHPWQKQHYSHVEDKDMMASRKPRNIFQMISDGLNNLMYDSFDRALVDGVPEQEQVSEEQEISDRIEDLVSDVRSTKHDIEDICESDVSDDVFATLNSASGYASLLVGALLEAERKAVNGMSNGNTLNLYLISQTINNDYDTFDSAVVAARDEEDAKSIHPIWPRWVDSYLPTVTQTTREAEEEKEEGDYNDNTWTTRENVEVKFIGMGSPDVKRGVICASYNAG